MECPQCKHPLTEATDRLRWLRFALPRRCCRKAAVPLYPEKLTLKNEIADLKRLQGSIGTALFRLSDQVGIFDQSLKEALGRTATSTRDARGKGADVAKSGEQ